MQQFLPSEHYDSECVSVESKYEQLHIQLNLCKTPNLKKDQKLVFNSNYRLMQVKSIAECSKGSILQSFRTSLSYYLLLRSFYF